MLMLKGNEMGCMKQQPPALLNYVEKGNNLHIILDVVEHTYIVEARIWWGCGWWICSKVTNSF
jgi:hypothetical protein